MDPAGLRRSDNIEDRRDDHWLKQYTSVVESVLPKYSMEEWKKIAKRPLTPIDVTLGQSLEHNELSEKLGSRDIGEPTGPIVNRHILPAQFMSEDKKTNSSEPKPVRGTVSFDDVFSAVGLPPVRTEPKSVKGVVPFDKVSPINEPPAPAEPKPKVGMIEKIGRNFETGARSDNNKRYGDLQFTNQAPRKEDYVGDATWDEEDNIQIKGADGSWSPTDRNQHIMFQDPEDGRHKIYKRDPTQDRSALTGRLVGLGHVVQEGFQAAPTRLPSTAGAATRGQQALSAADKVEEATGVGVAVPQNAVTESGIAQRAGAALQSVPGGAGAPFENAANRMEQGIEVAVAEARGAPVSAETAGSTARGAIENYAAPGEKGVLGRRVSKAYDKVDEFVDDTAPHALGNTLGTAENINQLYGATKQDGFAPSIKKVLGAVTDPDGVTYSGLKRLRSEIGELIETGAKTAETGMHEKDLKALYKSLTDDMRELVKTQGGERGLQLWERANNYAKLASERREKLGKILGTNRSDESIFGSILNKAGSANSADAATLALAKKSMPADEWAEVASAVVDKLGKRVTTAGTEFDSGKFIADYEKLSPRGKAILFGDNQRLRKALDSISDLAKFHPDARQPGQLSNLVGLGLAVGHTGSGEGVVGKIGGAMHILGGVLTGRVLSSMLSKPATAESVAKWMEGYKLATLKPTKGNVNLYNRATEALTNDAAQEDRENLVAAGKTIKDGAVGLAEKLSLIGGKK